MRKLVLAVHTSLDGFVASPDGGFDWFDASEENLEFVCRLTEEADAAMFGRISYQMLEAYWPTAKDRPNATKDEITYSTWYNRAQKIVFSKTLESSDRKNTTILRDIIPDEITHIKKQDGKNILLFGSPSVTRSLIQLNLIDSYWIFVYPVIFGSGIPLFTQMPNTSKLKLASTRQFSKGELATNYITYG